MTTTYAFEQHQGIGKHSVAPQAGWAKQDILSALTMGRGSLLCIFEDEQLRAILESSSALVDFSFQHVYPLVKEKGNKDARMLATLGYRYWIKQNIETDQLVALRKLLLAKNAGKHRSAILIAGERLSSPEPLEVARSVCLQGLTFEGVDMQSMQDAIKKSIRKLLR